MNAERTILLVDDNADLREVVAELLAGEGHLVAQAGDGQQALEWCLANGAPALMVLDLEMPRLGGWELLAVMRCHPSLAGVPVVIFSGAEISSAARAVYPVLPKTADAAVLAKMVNDLLSIERPTFG